MAIFTEEEAKIAEAILFKNKREIADHIMEKHHGWPATSCHICGNLQNGILSAERAIRDSVRGQLQS